MRAAVVMSDELSLQQDSLGSIAGLGSGKWVMDTGHGVAPAIVETARRVFSSVTVVPSVSEAGNADIVLVPSQVALSHPAGRNEYAVRFEMKAVAQKPNGKVGFEQLYSEEASGSERVAQNQGAAAAHEVLATPAERAIATVLTKLATDLRVRLGEPGAEAAMAVNDFPTPLPPPPLPTPAPAPIPTRAPAPVVRDDAPRQVIAPSLEVHDAPSESGRRTPLVIAGAATFLAGYATPIVISAVVPGGDLSMGLSFIPLAGPILGTVNNPYLSSDVLAWTLAIASTAVQATGIGLLIGGLVSGPSATPSASVHVVPTMMPNGGVGVAIAGTN